MRIAHHGPHGVTVVEAYGPEYGHIGDLFEELYETLKRKETAMLHWPWFRHKPTGEVKQFEHAPDHPDWEPHLDPKLFGSYPLSHAMRPLEGGGLDIRRSGEPREEDDDATSALGATLAAEEIVSAVESPSEPDPAPDFSGGGGDGGGGGASADWSDSGSSSADT
jgi:hypothetical protein